MRWAGLGGRGTRFEICDLHVEICECNTQRAVCRDAWQRCVPDLLVTVGPVSKAERQPPVAGVDAQMRREDDCCDDPEHDVARVGE